MASPTLRSRSRSALLGGLDTFLPGPAAGREIVVVTATVPE